MILKSSAVERDQILVATPTGPKYGIPSSSKTLEGVVAVNDHASHKIVKVLCAGGCADVSAGLLSRFSWTFCPSRFEYELRGRRARLCASLVFLKSTSQAIS